MFGLTLDKILVIGVIAVFLLGPERLPHYAAQLARLVRSVRQMADGAKERLREEMGPDFDDVDWKKLDPRQYDPRRIIREALVDDFDAPEQPVISIRPPESAKSEAATAETTGAESASRQREKLFAEHAEAPFDAEAT